MAHIFKMKKHKTKSYILISLGGVLIFFVAFLAYSEVDNSLTAETNNLAGITVMSGADPFGTGSAGYPS